MAENEIANAPKDGTDIFVQINLRFYKARWCDGIYNPETGIYDGWWYYPDLTEQESYVIPELSPTHWAAIG